jgi:hypothetical protein
VGYVGFKFQQVLFIFGIVFGDFDIGSRKSRKGVARFPKAESNEVRDVAFDPAQHPGAFIAGCRSVSRHAGAEKIVEIRVGDAGVCFTVPDSGDHFISLLGC